MQCDEGTFKAWLIVIEQHYRSSNTYHNSTHAADVMQVTVQRDSDIQCAKTNTFIFLSQATAAYLQQIANRDIRIMDNMDEATALLAAATHDIDHPGRSSAFLCNSDDQLALLYNDICVLESHHAATTFKLTLSECDSRKKLNKYLMFFFFFYLFDSQVTIK
jgi:high affinity cAMP-specific and IBMX-insensitive 3',5'-cyclic phosphodiesterase 8